MTATVNPNTATNETVAPLAEEGGVYYVDTRSTSQDPPAIGRHRFTIEKMEVKVSGPGSKNPGEQYLLARCRIIDGPDEGKAIFLNLMVSGPARFRFEQLCQAIGLSSPRVPLHAFEGREFEGDVDHDTYNGVTKGTISKIYVEGGDGPVGSAPRTSDDIPF